MPLVGGSIQVPVALQAGSVPAAIDKIVGGFTRLVKKIGKVNAALGLMTGAFVFFAARGLKKSTEEAIRFQTEMAELSKLLGPELARPIAEAMGDLSKIMPLARQELTEIAATAARLGVRGSGNIREFTRVMAMMGVATDISANTAADALARVALQTQTPIKDMEKVGSVINELANTMATSSSEIVAAVRRSAPEMSRFGLSIDQIVALNASLNTVSESATRAGTRMRRLFQSMTDVNKVGAFAEALEMTTGAFEAMRKEDPLSLVTDLIAVYAEGGVEADRLASNLDARARMALAALAQIYNSLEGNFESAAEQMQTAISLAREYDRFVGLITSKQQIYTNRIAETRREIGEQMLPLVAAYQDYLLNIAKIMGDIVDNPLEGVISDEALARAKEYANTFEDMAHAKARMEGERRTPTFLDAFSAQGWARIVQDPAGFAENMRNPFKPQVQPGSQDLEFDADALIRQINSVAERMPAFGRAFAAVGVEMVGAMTRGEVSTEKLNHQLGNLQRDLTTLGDAASDPQLAGLAVAWGKLYTEMAERSAAAGTSFEDFSAIISGFTTTAIKAADLQTDALVRAGNSYTGFSVQMQDALRPAEAAIDNFGKLGVVATLLDSSAYTGAITDVANLTEKQKKLRESGEELNRVDAKRLEVNTRFIATVVRVAAELEKLHASEQKRIKDEKEALKLEREKDQALADRIAVMEDVSALESRLTREIEGLTGAALISRNMAEMLVWVTSLRDLSKEAKDELRALIRQHGAVMQERFEADEIERAEKSLASMNTMDFTTLQGKMRLFERIITGLADSTVEFFDAMVTGSKDAGAAFVDMIKSITEELLRSQLMKLFLNVLGEGGLNIFDFPVPGTKELAAPSGALFGPAPKFGDIKPKLTPSFAEGGQLPMNTVALVGEEGAELFVPDEDDDVRMSKSRGKSVGSVEGTNFEIERDKTGDQKARVTGGKGSVVGKDGIIVGERGPELIQSEVPGEVVTTGRTPSVARMLEAEEPDVTVDIGDSDVQAVTPDVNVQPTGIVEPPPSALAPYLDMDAPELETTISVPQMADGETVDAGAPQVDVVVPDMDYDTPEIAAPGIAPTAIGPDNDLPVAPDVLSIAPTEMDKPDMAQMDVSMPVMPDMDMSDYDTDMPDVNVPDMSVPDMPDVDISQQEMISVPELRTEINPEVAVVAPTPRPIFKQTFGSEGKLSAPTGKQRDLYVESAKEEIKDKAERVSGKVVPRDFFPTMMAKGGAIDSEQMAIVGEKGPELFVPDVSGTIVPNNKVNATGKTQEMTVNVNNNFTIQALDGASVRSVLAKEKEFITGMTLTSIDRSRALQKRRR